MKDVNITIPPGHAFRNAVIHLQDGKLVVVNSLRTIKDLGLGLIMFESDTPSTNGALIHISAIKLVAKA